MIDELEKPVEAEVDGPIEWSEGQDAGYVATSTQPEGKSVMRALLQFKKMFLRSGKPVPKYMDANLEPYRGMPHTRQVLVPSGKYIPAGPYKNTTEAQENARRARQLQQQGGNNAH